MKMARSLLTVLTLGTATVTASFDAEAKEIMIGCSLPMTGPLSAYGTVMHNGLTIAVDDFNKRGELGGDTVVALCEDSKGDPKETINIAKKFIDDPNVVAVISDFSSTQTLAAADTYCRAGLIQMTPSASHPDIPKQCEWIFRGGPTNEHYVTPVPAYLRKELGLSSVAVVSLQTDWGVSVSDTFSAAADSVGIEIVAREAFTPRQKDYRTVITKLQRLDPDGLYLVMLDEDLAIFLQQLKQVGWDDVLTFEAGAGLTPKLLQLAGNAANGLYSTGVFTPLYDSPQTQHFVKLHKERFDKAPDSYTANGYETANLILNAIKKVHPNVTRETVRDALVQTENYPGVTGTIAIDKKTHEIERDRSNILRVVDGEVRLIDSPKFKALLDATK